MENEKKYYAFISYKREDEKWAKWLQHKLEHYKLPSNLNGRTDLPKEIRPIFRDQSELAAGVLADEINKALTNSKYLIVICSPRAAQSQWVGKEVQTFIDLGRTDKIIPFIIGGTAHAQKPEEECFPLALLNLSPDQELLGINIDEMGRDASAVKVVAQMFRLKFDTLWQRYERENRRRRVFVIVAALFLALVGVGVAVGFSRQNKKITEQKQRIVIQNEEILKKNDRLKNDSIVMAAQIDSINRRDAIITQQQDSINNTNVNLELINKKLIIERNNLKKANLETMRNYAMVVSEQANRRCEEGNYYEARRLALSVLPKDLSNPDYPYTPEAEYALRKAFEYDSFIISDDVVDGILGDREYVYVNVLQSYSVQNGEQIMAACIDKIGVWDAKTGAMIKFWSYNDAQDGNGDYLLFNNDSSLILFPIWNDLLIINPETGNVVDTLKHDDWIENVCVNYDNDIVAVSVGNNIYIWNLSSRQIMQTISKDNPIEQVKFLFEGSAIAVVAKESTKVEIIDIKMQTTIGSLLHPKYVGAIGVNPTNNQIATICEDSIVRIWEPSTGELLTSLQGGVHSYGQSFFYSEDGKKMYLTNDYSKPTICWDLNTNKEEILSSFPAGPITMGKHDKICVERCIVDLTNNMSVSHLDDSVINNAQLPIIDKSEYGYYYGWYWNDMQVNGRCREGSLIETPKSFVDALSEKGKTFFVEKVYYSFDGELCLVFVRYHEKEEVIHKIALFKNKKLVNILVNQEFKYDCGKWCDSFVWEFSPQGNYLFYNYFIDEEETSEEQGSFLCETASGEVLWCPQWWYDTKQFCFFYNDNYIVYSREEMVYDNWGYCIEIAEIRTGKVVQRIKLDRPIVSLTMSKDDRYIFAQEIEGDESVKVLIWEFKPLQELIDQAKMQIEKRDNTRVEIKDFSPREEYEFEEDYGD